MDIGRKEIDLWHRQRGMFEIGYHRVIRRDGTIEQGRQDDEMGAHALGFNSFSLGVCLVGGTGPLPVAEPEANFTPAQMRALNSLLLGWKHSYADAKIVGHHELPSPHSRSKACPSFNVQQWLAAGQPEDVSPFPYR
jgi:N-acetylmuramoyl-L-alanine amidase